MHRRLWIPAPLAVMASLLVCACGRPEAGGPSVQVLSSFVPASLDPYRDPRLLANQLFLNIYEPLVDTSADGRVRPVLAESWTNPDPCLYVFRLRPGVLFHDGTPLTARAVAEAFAAARSEGSFLRGLLADVETIEVRDERTLALKTTRPVLDLVFALISVVVARPVPASRSFVGTGRYEVVSFRPGEEVRLRRFERHRDDRPWVRESVFRRFADVPAAVAALDAEPLTMVMDPPHTLVEGVRRLSGFEVVRRPGMALVYLAVNLRPGETPNRPLRDPRVRQAIHLALDRGALVASGTALGSGVAANQLVPRGVFGFDPDLPEPVRDLRRARALLAEAGLANGADLDLDSTVASETLALHVAAQLSEVGLRVRVRSAPPERFVAQIEDGSDFYLYSWVSGLESASALRSFLHTRDAARGHGLRNRTGYSNPRVDALLEAAMGAARPEDRLQPMRRAMRLLMQDLPWVPLIVPDTARICPSGIEILTHIDGTMRLWEWRRR